MKGFSYQAFMTLLGLAVVVLLAYLVFVQGPTQVKIIQQPAAPTEQPKAETVKIAQWDLLVTLADEEGKPVYDANIWLLYEKPADIYKTPTTNIYKSATDVNESYTFENVRAGKTYFVLAAAPGFYNGGTEVNMPSELPKDIAELGQPVTVDVSLTHKGTIIGVQVPLTYRGSSADVAKFVYSEDTEKYETEFQYVVDNSGEVRYKKLRVDLNTDNLGSATIDELIVTVGEKEFDISDISTSKIIEFEDEQVIPKAGTLTVHITMDGVDLDTVSGQLLKVTLYDVQEGEYEAVVEGPA